MRQTTQPSELFFHAWSRRPANPRVRCGRFPFPPATAESRQSLLRPLRAPCPQALPSTQPGCRRKQWKSCSLQGALQVKPQLPRNTDEPQRSNRKTRIRASPLTSRYRKPKRDVSSLIGKRAQRNAAAAFLGFSEDAAASCAFIDDSVIGSNCGQSAPFPKGFSTFQSRYPLGALRYDRCQSMQKAGAGVTVTDAPGLLGRKLHGEAGAKHTRSIS